MLKKLKPIYFENSKVPVFLSYFSPININAITIVFFVFSRGKLGDRVKNHERIHLQQYLECLIIPFLIIYLVDYVVGYIKYRDGKKAYRMIRFEQEAYSHDSDLEYSEKRKHYSWFKYRI
tara:strand:- start:14 stop:373 length:360 start_codon:yes stop_codon:yes gene_type:complete